MSVEKRQNYSGENKAWFVELYKNSRHEKPHLFLDQASREICLKAGDLYEEFKKKNLKSTRSHIASILSANG